jgi:hypothetical protein
MCLNLCGNTKLSKANLKSSARSEFLRRGCQGLKLVHYRDLNMTSEGGPKIESPLYSDSIIQDFACDTSNLAMDILQRG